MVQTIGIALSGLDSASKRLYASASNIANARSTGTLDGSGRQPYFAVDTQNQNNGQGGVSTQIVPKQTPFVPSFDPGSPLANEQGMVAAPNVNLDTELVNTAIAEYSYKANALVIDKSQEMAETLLNSFDDEA